MAIFREDLISSLDDAVLARIDRQFRDCRQMSASEIIAALLQEYGSTTTGDVDALHATLNVPLISSTVAGLEALIARQGKALAALEQCRQAPTEASKTSFLRKAAQGTKGPDGANMYHLALTLFLREHRDVHTQTWDALATCLLEAAEQANFPEPTPPAAVSMGQLYAHAAYDTLAAPTVGGPLPHTVAPMAHGATAAAPAPRPPKVFCHTHGWGTHTSANCRYPAAPEHDNAVNAPTAAHPNGIKGRFRRP
jgi:hypothetical protein